MKSCPHCRAELEPYPSVPGAGSCPACGRALPSSPERVSWATLDEIAADAGVVDASATDTPSAERRPERVGRYRIHSTLGEGGFGAVYRGFDEELRREIAVKVPHADRIRSEEDIESYLAEARALAGLDHPHIVPVYDVGRTDDGRCYLVSKFLEGKDLSGELEARRFSHEQAAELVVQIADALHHAHQRGLVHRDVKPANILLDAAGVPYIADFGLALREDDIIERGTVVGTPQYMSPEQASGEAHRVDARSDVYSLGVVLYELLTGRTPFRSKQVRELIQKITTGEPRPPRQVDDRIPKPLDRICLKAISRKVRDRYSTAADFAEDLRQWLASGREGTVTRPLAGADGSIHSSSLPVPFAATPQSQVGMGASASASAFEGGPASSSGSLSGSSAVGIPAVSVSDLTRIAVVPKGLRSFGPEDASFFLELLPGPRDREGLPDSVRFWKRQIEETDPEATFAIGLIYGPSGCGKSSMMKAGILPRLRSNVTPFYLEATPAGTEERILMGLRRLFPGMPQDLDLPDSLLALRQGEGLPRGEKLVLVIDQFEQWLHMHRGESGSDLVRALRQCDPSRVQCVIMVRDDFWMSVSRFMRELEVWLVEGHNSAAVDLFSLRHSRKVLTGFGRALGSLPERDQELTEDQKEFVRRAVEDLSEDGKVISVRLALFADMLKNRSWSTRTLREVGGAEGIGTRFFEETFSSQGAPPEHRLHQQAARRVLRALIFLSGDSTDIKGGVRTRSELLEASGYASRPDAFEHLLMILDRELRIVTPTDSSGVGPSLERGVTVSPESVGPAADESTEPCYQLTHDYLVKPLRLWLTKKQRETMRGRAELRLSDRATLWCTKPQRAYLPSAWEWANIELLTRRRDWTVPQQRMMRAATRLHATVLALLVVAVVGLGLGAREVHGRLEAGALHERLLYVEPAEVPRLIEEIEPFRSWVDPLLRETLETASADSRERLNASLALLPVDTGPLDHLRERAFTLDGSELEVVRDAFVPHRGLVSEGLWRELEDETREPSRRLRAATLLAGLEKAGSTPRVGASQELDPRWKAQAPYLMERLIGLSVEDTGRHDELLQGLAPVGLACLDALRAIYRDLDRSESDRSVAQNVALEFSGDHVAGVVDLLVSTGLDGRHAASFERLEKQPEIARAALREVLGSRIEDEEIPEWKDAPLLPGWDAVAPDLHVSFEKALGWIDERFASCQTMPLAEALAVAERLRPSGYRPDRFRPYAHGDRVLVAAVWTREAVEWRLEAGLMREAVNETAGRWAVDGYVPRDLSCYLEGGEPRFALVGIRDAKLEWVESLVGADSEAKDEFIDRVNEGTNRPVSWHLTRLEDGEERFSSVWVRGEGLPERLWFWHGASTRSSVDANEFLLEDLTLVANPSPAELRAVELRRAESALEKSPEDAGLLLAKGRASSALLRNAEALESLGRAIDRAPDSLPAYFARIEVLARLGRIEEARADLATSVRLGAEPWQRSYLEAYVEAYSGAPLEAARAYAAKAAARADDGTALYLAAAFLAEVSALVESEERRSELRDRALDLLESSLELSRYIEWRLSDRAWDTLREHPRLRRLHERLQLDLRFSAIRIGRPDLEAEAIYGLEAPAHLEKARELARSGYRPRSLSTTSLGSDRPPMTAAVWQRPFRHERSREAFASRRANAALMLARLGEPEHLWPLLILSPEPRERGYLVRSLASSGVGAEALLRRLDEEPEVSVRRAILLALGDVDVRSLSDSLRSSALASVAGLLERDPDPGVHSAAEWLLERWGEEARVRDIGERLARGGSAASPSRSRRWRVDAHGNTLVRIDGPVEVELGSQAHEVDRGYHEQPHLRRIPRSYEIATREVTVEQFREFLDENPGELGKFEIPADADPRAPVTGVSWLDARRYCEWLSEKERSLQALDRDRFTSKSFVYSRIHPLDLSGYRLPTEWEWEHAARAGTRTAYGFGDSRELLKQYGWFTGSFVGGAAESAKPRLMPVGRLRPGDLGLFDAHGNVIELCQDLYVERFFDPDKRVHEETTQGEWELVSGGAPVTARGGHAAGPAAWSRSSERGWRRANERKSLQGFRVARTVPAFGVLPQDRVFLGRAELLVTGETGEFSVENVPAGLEVSPRRGVAPTRLSVRSVDGEAREFRFDVREAGTDRVVTARGVLAQGPEWTVSYHDWVAQEKPPTVDENWREILARPPLATRTAAEVQLLWGEEAPAADVPKDRFATVAETRWRLPEGRYELSVLSDDGVRVTIDGRRALNGWGRVTRASVEVELEAGEHPIRVEHYDIGGVAYLVLEMRQKP